MCTIMKQNKPKIKKGPLPEELGKSHVHENIIKEKICPECRGWGWVPGGNTACCNLCKGEGVIYE